MYFDAEHDIFRSIGAFSTVAQVSITANSYGSGYVGDSYYSSFYGLIPSQCAAFLTTTHVFTLFVETWEINRESGNPVFQNKKVYPLKATGLGIPFNKTQTFRWRDGLIDNSFNQIDSYRSYFRPGFGQTIMSDLSRPLISASVTQNMLGMGPYAGEGNAAFVGPFGRLMSMAFWIDPIEAEKYDKSQNKKKKKSLNEQDYQQMPVYPPYTPYQDNSGY